MELGSSSIQLNLIFDFTDSSFGIFKVKIIDRYPVISEDWAQSCLKRDLNP